MDDLSLPQEERIIAFRDAVWSNYQQEGRQFPWRNIDDSWGVLVSEVMLQQTQTVRVVPYWLRWMEKWSTPEALAQASLEEVLREWAGLGYNRRGRYLKLAAQMIVEDFHSRVPESEDDLRKLPGIGPYTAGAIACFAFNKPTVFVETNIRAAVIHFFYQDKTGISDRDILSIVARSLDYERPRHWYYALMDYGAALKRITANPNRRSAAYTKQSRFEGSLRQVRGSILRLLTFRGASTLEDL
ncbi:MAG: A/G-specific adenine glycosylase, partial [Termitinemataceae bacterium]